MPPQPSVENAATITAAKQSLTIHHYPMVYSLTTRVFLKELSHLFGSGSGNNSRHSCTHSAHSGGCVTFEDVPDRYLDWIASMGFSYVYLLGVWTTGKDGEKAAGEFMQKHFPDVPKNEVCSSPFAITDYHIHPDFGGIDAFQRFRRRLARRNIRLILDFVPNHVGLDHPWVTHPTKETKDFILCGNEELIKKHPNNYFRVNNRIIAHGKDPYYDGWVDTAQLNYFSSGLRKAMIETLEHISDLCDGVRCDMAMLVNTEIFKKTWGDVYQSIYSSSPNVTLDFPEFWQQAITRVLMKHPDFIFLGEVYWDQEQTMMDFGFHYVYDKNVYDNLKSLDHGSQLKQWILKHALTYHEKSCHFLENHDESRAANVWQKLEVYRAAATIAFCLPGMKLFHFGQLEGRRIKIPMQRCRLGKEDQGDEAADRRASIFDFYYRLLDILNRFPVMRMGMCEMIDPQPSSPNPHENGHESIIAFTFYELHSRTSVVRNASHAMNMLASASAAHRRLGVDHPLGGGPGYISDESSSVPRSSTISEPDVDEMSETTFATSTVQTTGQSHRNRTPPQQQKEGVPSGVASRHHHHGGLHPPEHHQHNHLSKASQASAITLTEQSVALALNRSSSDAPPQYSGIPHGTSSVDGSYLQEQQQQQNGDIEIDKLKADEAERERAAEKEEGYVSDTEESEFDLNGESSSSSTPIITSAQPPVMFASSFEFDPKCNNKKKPTQLPATTVTTPVVSGVPTSTPPNPFLWSASSSDRWNPILVVVNYSPHRAHGYVQLPKTLLRAFYARTGRFSVASSFPHSAEANFQVLGLTQSRGYILLRELFIGSNSYRRNLLEAMTRGIWFDLEPYATHVFETLLLDEV